MLPCNILWSAALPALSVPFGGHETAWWGECGAAMCAVWRSCIFLQFFRPVALIIQKSRALRGNALKFFELHFCLPQGFLPYHASKLPPVTLYRIWLLFWLISECGGPESPQPSQKASQGLHGRGKDSPRHEYSGWWCYWAGAALVGAYPKCT